MKFLINSYKRLSISGMIIMLVYRVGNFLKFKFNIPILDLIFLIIYKFIYIIITIVFNAEFPEEAKIGKGIKLPHGGKGVIINKNSIIGDNVTIYHQVTLGTNGLEDRAPVIEDNVMLGVGSKIIGGVTIGKNSIVGANSVVTKDISNNSIVAGIPAKFIRYINI